MLLRTFTIILTILTAGCSTKIKQKLGVTTIGPNEYQVMRSKPLEVPPHYNLPTPINEISGKLTPNTHQELTKQQDTILDESEKALLKEVQ